MFLDAMELNYSLLNSIQRTSLFRNAELNNSFSPRLLFPLI